MICNLIYLITLFVLPSAALAQADPGPPPTSAAAVPTMVQAKEFIEENFSSAAAGVCPKPSGGGDKTYRASIEIDGRNFRIMNSEITKNQTSTTQTIEESNYITVFNIKDVIELVEVSKEECGRGLLVGFICKYGTKCMNQKWDAATITTWPDRPNIEPIRTDQTEETTLSGDGIVIFNNNKYKRIVKAINFYRKTLLETEGESPF